jgi:hypothetical protein
MRYDIRLGWWKDGMELLANRWCEAEGEEGKGKGGETDVMVPGPCGNPPTLAPV